MENYLESGACPWPSCFAWISAKVSWNATNELKIDDENGWANGQFVMLLLLHLVCLSLAPVGFNIIWPAFCVVFVLSRAKRCGNSMNNSMSCSNKLVYSSHYGINGDKQFFSSLFGWCAHTNAHIWYLRIYYKKEKYVYCHHLLVIFWLFNALAQQHHIVSRRRNEPKKKKRNGNVGHVSCTKSSAMKWNVSVFKHRVSSFSKSIW